jgi:hypothetical protein
MVAQIVTILLLLLGQEHVPLFYTLGQVGLWVVVILSLASAIDYVRRFQAAMSTPPPTVVPR